MDSGRGLWAPDQLLRPFSHQVSEAMIQSGRWKVIGLKMICLYFENSATNCSAKQTTMTHKGLQEKTLMLAC